MRLICAWECHCGPPGAVGAAGLLPRNQQISGLPPLLSSSEAMRILCKTSGGWIPFVYIRSNSELRKRTTERAGRAVARIMRDLEFLEALDLQYLEQVEALLGKIRSKAIHLDLSSSTQGELQRNAPRMQRDAPRGRKLYSLDEVLSVATHPDDASDAATRSSA